MRFPGKHWLTVLCMVTALVQSSSAIGQISGSIIDAESGDSLAFAHILGLRTQNGCFSGLDGRFSLPQVATGDSVRITLLGYLPQTLVARLGSRMEVKLVPGGVTVQDVLIVPTENPALRILRNAVANRASNDPSRLSDFQSDCYNKLSASPVYGPHVPDSARMKHHLFLSETVTHRIQQAPGQVKEKILSARLAGYPGKVIPFTAADLQDLSFYGNYVKVIGQQFLSPISAPGLRQYDFTLVDTLVVGPDSIFTLDFHPSNADFDGFQGQLRIESGAWALLTVSADLVLHEPGLLISRGKVQQVHTQLPTGEWVPAQVHTSIVTKPLSNGEPFQLLFNGFSEFTGQRLGAPLAFRSPDALTVSESAGSEDSVLQMGRTRKLDGVDSLTYNRLDSLGRAFGLSRIFDQVWKINEGKIMIGPVDVLLHRFLTNNRIEKSRLGLGLSTNENLSRRFSVAGFAGWGLGDREWKYGGQLQVTPLGDDRLYAGISVAHDLVESGYRRLGLRPERGLTQNAYQEYGIRNWYLRNMEYVDVKEAWLGIRLPSDLGLRLARRWEVVDMAYPYEFQGGSKFAFDEVEATLRWAPGAHYAQNAGRRVLLQNNAPVMLLRYTKGLDTQQGDYPYNGLAMSVSHAFQAFRGGRAAFQILGGWNDQALPRSRMHVYRSNYDRRNFTQLDGTFNTMRYDEFEADMYGEAFFYLSPRLRWLHIGKRFQPRLHFSAAAAWGALYPSSNSQTNPGNQAPTKVYWEAGMAMSHFIGAPKSDNLLFSWIRSIGVGVYYRMGPYTLPTWKENIALRLTLGAF